ncbi:MAG: adenosylhomocysteinase [Defluviitaleaceae bacterium]|nr:adenosylhomocysteinase [Defluviitaleaceae bacterium]MCL2273287.1 adenosylhomocysteinase [Defluviitaleaceae bacterium]
MSDSIIRDISLAPAGNKKIEWVKEYMPVLSQIEERFKKEQPFKGMRIAVCVHLEAKTAYLGKVLASGGADVAITGSNSLSTKDDICAGLVSQGYKVYAWHGATEEEYWEHLRKTLEFKPHIVIDDGGDFMQLLHGDYADYAENLIGGCEETTTGINRLKARVREGTLKIPMMAVNDADSKHLFDNVHGTGQSVWDSIMYTTNVMLTGRDVVVAGYGFCGKGVAMRAKGLGARVIVTEINPWRAMEAVMDGFQVMKMDDAARIGEFFVTVTGCNDVITARHYEVMKHNAFLANAGHFDVEVNLVELEKMSTKKEIRRPFIEGYHMKDGRILNVLAEGKLVNIVAGNGHPADIMDMSFALQAMGAEHLAKNGKGMKPDLYNIPVEVDREIALMKSKAMGLGLDVLSPEQEKYFNGYY